MKTMTVDPIENMVKSMRQIREDISKEIKDMSYAEEREFLDKLLKKNTTSEHHSKAKN